MPASFTELARLPEPGHGLKHRLLAGEYFLVREAMQQAGVFDELREASLRGIERALGAGVRGRVAELGFERTHEVVQAADIPRMTESVYAEALRMAPSLLRRAVPRIIGLEEPFYFERFPNIRFHIPFDAAAGLKDTYKEFGKKRGDGKITAHGPHRDSWLDCPLNSVNIWVAIGPIDTGNGLLIYPERYEKDVVRNGCHIRGDQAPGKPTNAAMAPGDALVFHGDQLHASVLNHTSHTRHVISFRLTLDMPKFADTHLQAYAHSSLAVGPLATGPLGFVAEIPAAVQKTHVKTRLRQARELVRRALGGQVDTPPSGAPTVTAAPVPDALRASSLLPGVIRAVDGRTCVARLGDGSVVAFGRRCTHEGADLSLGYVDGDRIRCPWHNLPFDPKTGENPCKSLKRLKTFPASVEGDRIVVASDTPSADVASRGEPAVSTPG